MIEPKPMGALGQPMGRTARGVRFPPEGGSESAHQMRIPGHGGKNLP